MNGGTMGDASEYFKSLISEGYTSDEALNYTIQHFPEFKLELHDSVIAGDVITNQSITSADADVVRAAMEGVVDAIRELQPTESKEVSEPKLAPLPPLPPMLTVDYKVDLDSSKRKSRSWPLVNVIVAYVVAIGVLVLVGGLYMWWGEEGTNTSVPSRSYSINWQQDNTPTFSIHMVLLDVDTGFDGKDITLEVYWDEDDTGEFREGVKCSTLIRYHDSETAYGIDKICNIPMSPLTETVSITLCVYYDDYEGDDVYYDIYSGNSSGGSCVIWRDNDLSHLSPSPPWDYTCDYDGEIQEQRSTLDYIIGDGLYDEEDSNELNAYFRIDYEIYDEFKCIYSW